MALVLSSNHVGSEDGTQVPKLGSKHLYSLSRLTRPRVIILQYNEIIMVNTVHKNLEYEMDGKFQSFRLDGDITTEFKTMMSFNSLISIQSAIHLGD